MSTLTPLKRQILEVVQDTTMGRHNLTYRLRGNSRSVFGAILELELSGLLRVERESTTRADGGQGFIETYVATPEGLEALVKEGQGNKQDEA